MTDEHYPRSSVYNRWSGALHRAKTGYVAITKNWNYHTFVAEVFGPTNTWFVPEFEASEWGFILYLFKTHSATRVIRLSITTVGSVLIPPLGVVLYTRFLMSRHASEKVRYVGEKYAPRNIEADEDWWFINGTGVNTDLQAANGYHIAEIFHKQVRLYYNPTSGLLFDLAQCAVGLISYRTKPSSQLAKSLMARFAASPTVKVILVVHSMGAVISANAVKYMIRKGWTKDLYRLEIYTFGSPCIDFMHVICPQTLRRVPFYEHYCNEEDYISKMGALRIRESHWWTYLLESFNYNIVDKLRIGRVFVRQKQGHFFGEHYLPGIEKREYIWHNSTKQSRLYKYLPPPSERDTTDSPYSIPDYCLNPRRPRLRRHKIKAPILTPTTTLPPMTRHYPRPPTPPFHPNPSCASHPTEDIPSSNHLVIDATNLGTDSSLPYPVAPLPDIPPEALEAMLVNGPAEVIYTNEPAAEPPEPPSVVKEKRERRHLFHRKSHEPAGSTTPTGAMPAGM